MADADDDPLAVIMAALRSRLDARVRVSRDVAARLRDLAARYAAAVKADADAELARRQGRQAPPPTASPAELAAELFEVAAGLPELYDEPADRAPPPPPAQASGGPVSFPELMASVEPPQPPVRERAAPPGPHPDVLRLLDDFRSFGLEQLSTPIFRAVAEELAARVRLLQEQGVADPDDSLRYVMRALTSVAHKRGGGNIFGLDRKHQADWAERASRARQRRLKLAATPPKAKPAALPRQADDDDGDDDEPEARWPLPRLAARASTAAVVLIGGVRKPAKLGRVREHLGFDVEWIETATNGMASTTALERRIRDGRVAAVVVLEGLMSHKHSEPIVAAARQLGVPLAYGGTAGIGTVKEAFTQLEAML